MPPVDSEEFLRGISATVSSPLLSGGTATLLDNGDQFFPAVLADLERSKEIHGPDWRKRPLFPTRAGALRGDVRRAVLRPAGPAPPRAFENQTGARSSTSASAAAAYVRLSNAFGARPLRIGAARVAIHAEGASILPGSDRALRFSGRSSITIPTGAVALSDAVDLVVPTRGISP